MGIEEINKESIRRQIEVFNSGHVEILPEIISPDFSMMDPSGVELKGPDGFSQMVTLWRSVFPDLHFTIDDMVAEGDRVAIHFTYTGTFKGKWGDTEPTGNHIEISEAIFYVLKDGKEVSQTNFIDWLTFYQQMGITPPNPS